MEFFQVVTLEQARQALCQRLAPQLRIGKYEIGDSLGRVCAEVVKSACRVPDFDKSTVDGYAVRCSDTCGSSESVPTMLSVVGQVEMGREYNGGALSSGQAVYVPTGAMMPIGADSVVMIEHTERFADKLIAINKPLRFNENVLLAGEDVEEGQVLCNVGRTITSKEIGMFAECGVSCVKAYAPLDVYIISTGDELVSIDSTPLAGQIRDSNAYMLSSQARADGMKVVGCERVKDQLSFVKDAISRGLDRADIVLLSGGSSVGERDYVYSAIQSLGGEVFVKGVALKPGKPTMLGQVKGKTICGLPGHPFAAYVAYRLVIDYAVRQICNQPERRGIMAAAQVNFPSTAGRTTIQPVRLSYGYDGAVPLVYPVFGKSGLLNLMHNSDGFVQIDRDEEGVNAGQTVIVYEY